MERQAVPGDTGGRIADGLGLERDAAGFVDQEAKALADRGQAFARIDNASNCRGQLIGADPVAAVVSTPREQRAAVRLVLRVRLPLRGRFERGGWGREFRFTASCGRARVYA
jgi:hypothetical protein